MRLYSSLACSPQIALLVGRARRDGYSIEEVVSKFQSVEDVGILARDIHLERTYACCSTLLAATLSAATRTAKGRKFMELIILNNSPTLAIPFLQFSQSQSLPYEVRSS